MVPRLLHLVGSATSDFLAGVSRAYAADCLTANEAEGFNEQFVAYIDRTRRWRLPRTLNQADIESAPTLSETEGTAKLGGMRIDAVLPHMFCLPGMTRYRQQILDAGLPLVGNFPKVMGLAADKWATREVVSAAGVRVPRAERLADAGSHRFVGPVVVKPATADNSSGVTLVRHAKEIADAYEDAARHSDVVFAEQYIPAGREVRCGVVQTNDRLRPLPLQEYAIDERNRPIRGTDDKLVTDPSGKIDLASKHGAKPWIVGLTDPIVEAVQQMAIACFVALGCRHHALFDFRVDPAGTPWFLEAGLYCSFAPRSVLVMMAAAAGVSRADLLRGAIEEARTASSAFAIPDLPS